MTLHRQLDRIAAFIDGSNNFASVEALGFDINYDALRAWLDRRGALVRVYYFTAIRKDADGYATIQPLVDFLLYHGYTVIVKDTRSFESGGVIRTKGNMDIELAVKSLQISDHYDHAFIFSGDGDFRSLVEVLQDKGKRVTIVSSIATKPPMCADILRKQADAFIELNDLRPQIARD